MRMRMRIRIHIYKYTHVHILTRNYIYASDPIHLQEALRKRSEGGSVSSAGAHKHNIPQALRAMENLANKRADFSHTAGSGADMLGKLERAHGIRYVMHITI